MKTIKVKNWSEVPANFTGIVEHVRGDKFWYLNSKLHREDGPAIEYVNGNKYWYLNGKCHRIDSPAVEYINGDKYWYLDGKRHRIDGPAVDCVDGYKVYWINDVEVTKEAQEVLYAMYKLKGLL